MTNSRQKARTPSVWRRRQCNACVAQFSTLELPDFEKSLAVEGLRGKLYPFSRDKLFLSLFNSLGHRRDALPSATALTDTVIGKLLRKQRPQPGTINVRDLSRAAYATLKRYDTNAAHTYRAYHQSALD